MSAPLFYDRGDDRDEPSLQMFYSAVSLAEAEVPEHLRDTFLRLTAHHHRQAADMIEAHLDKHRAEGRSDA